MFDKPVTIVFFYNNLNYKNKKYLYNQKGSGT